jgi:DNA-directed RNA polymerase II subunit RPB1
MGTKSLKRIQFSLFDPEEIEKYAVCQVSHTDLYDNDGEPKFHGLFDTRMGVIDPNLLCSTCQKDIKNCPGHPGKIVLHKRVYLPQFLTTVLKILQSVCYECSSLLMDDSSIVSTKKKNQTKFRIVHENSKDVSCCHDCGCVQPKYSKNNLHIFIGKKRDNVTEKMILDTDECFRILNNISDDECKIFGLDPKFSRPEWMIINVLQVVPPCVRPSVVHDSNMRSEDDLTQKYLEILKSNNALKEKMDTIEMLRKEKNEKIQEFLLETKDMTKAEEKYKELFEKHERVVEDAHLSVQIQVTTLINNKLPGVPEIQNRSHLPLKCLTQRLVTKGGRIRGNLMGKRVDFSARSVITPDPKIDIDQVGVPRTIAMNLTFPETVNEFTITKCKKWVENGPDVFPGALFIIKKNGMRLSLAIIRRKLKEFSEKKPEELSGREEKIKENFSKKLELEFGDVVERHMMDEDWILFNRQPSLHRMSMLAHRVKVLEYDTFRLNPNVTACYNADKFIDVGNSNH